MVLRETITVSIPKQCLCALSKSMHARRWAIKLKLADWEGVIVDWWKQLKDAEEKT